MAVGTVKVTANKVKNRKKSIKMVKIILLSLLFVLLVFFILLSLIYKGGRFTISLDPNFSAKSGIVLYNNLEEKRVQRKLNADPIDFMDNISINWLPDDLDKQEGSHNGENYIAYSFYIENQGENILNYWYQVQIKDVIKNVDEAVRIMIYHNQERTVYAKLNGDTNEPEENTTPFYSEKIPVLKARTNFAPGEIDKFTVVIWLEGDDPDCVDAIIGGEIKMQMDISEEHVEGEVNNG